MQFEISTLENVFESLLLLARTATMVSQQDIVSERTEAGELNERSKCFNVFFENVRNGERKEFNESKIIESKHFFRFLVAVRSTLPKIGKNAKFSLSFFFDFW